MFMESEQPQINNLYGIKGKKPDKSLVELVYLSLMDKSNKCFKYAQFKDLIKDDFSQAILWKMHLNDIKHKKLLENIYFHVTGEKFIYDKMAEEEESVQINSLDEAINEMIFEKLETVEYLRKIYYAIFNLTIRDMLFEIITDEQAHAIKLCTLQARACSR